MWHGHGHQLTFYFYVILLKHLHQNFEMADEPGLTVKSVKPLEVHGDGDLTHVVPGGVDVPLTEDPTLLQVNVPVHDEAETA